MYLKKVAHVVVLIIFCNGIIGCATSRQDRENRMEARYERVEYYEREAREWRRDGIDTMGVYFEEKAKKEKSRDRYYSDGIVGLILGILFY